MATANLTDKILKAIKPNAVDAKGNAYLAKGGEPVKKLYDGHGLYVVPMLHRPEGQQLRWDWAYERPNGKRTDIIVGYFPSVDCEAARAQVAAWRVDLANGIDPSAERKQRKVDTKAGKIDNLGRQVDCLFRSVAASLKASMGWTGRRQDKFDNVVGYAMPALGDMPCADIKGLHLVDVITAVQKQGKFETARQLRTFLNQIMGHAVLGGFCEVNLVPTIGSKVKTGRLVRANRTPFAAITDPVQLGQLVVALRAHGAQAPRHRFGGRASGVALQLQLLTMQRGHSIREAEWVEFDLDAGVWTIPAAKMKGDELDKADASKDHPVPLPRQAVALLRAWREDSRYNRTSYVFPNADGKDAVKPHMDGSAMCSAMRSSVTRAGLPDGVHVPHGTRATCRTMINRALGFHTKYLEAQLAHIAVDDDGKAVELGDAYARDKWVAERATMMQAWADYLDTLAGTPASAPVAANDEQVVLVSAA